MCFHVFNYLTNAMALCCYTLKSDFVFFFFDGVFAEYV